MSNPDMISERDAIAYLRQRFPEARLEFITTGGTGGGMVTGHIFHVGRSKHAAGYHIRRDMLELFADGIQYSRDKAAQRKAERERIATLRRHERMVADYVSEGLGE